jgi:hypothetical protein
MKRASAIVAGGAALFGIAGVLHADEVLLRGGGRIEGVIVERTAERVVLDVGPGRVTLAASRVERVVSSPSALSTFRERAGRLARADAAGWLELGLWARGHGLPTQAREAFEHVLALDPDDAGAHRALGHVRLGERWAGPEEALRAQGLVPFEGRWVSPDERDAVLRERADAAAEERARAEASARAREAEARARAAEAEARRAEAEARQAEAASYGVTSLPFVFGGGLGPGLRGDFVRHPSHHPPTTVVVVRPVAPPRPAPKPTPAPRAHGSARRR